MEEAERERVMPKSYEEEEEDEDMLISVVGWSDTFLQTLIFVVLFIYINICLFTIMFLFYLYQCLFIFLFALSICDYGPHRWANIHFLT